METDNLQDRVDNLQDMVEKEPVTLDYARVENKRNWKKIVIYGGITIGVLTLGGYALCRYVDSLGLGEFSFIPV